MSARPTSPRAVVFYYFSIKLTQKKQNGDDKIIIILHRRDTRRSPRDLARKIISKGGWIYWLPLVMGIMLCIIGFYNRSGSFRGKRL